jgi:hypothetical protein
MKRFPLLLGILCALTTLQAETVSDLKSWAIEGGVQMDPSKPGPAGKPSIRLDPKSKASLKLRDNDGSGKVSFFIYDDGTVASPSKQKAAGPRWGTAEASGRVFLGGIMYAPYLQAEGSVCLIDTDPKASDAWNAVKFLSPRGPAGWKKWELDFHPETGLAITVDGKPVPSRYFFWNDSQVSAFNGLAFYGDDSPGAAAQTLWIADINYELGPPMKVKPGSLPPPPLAQAKGPAPEEETEKSNEQPVIGKLVGYAPKATLLDDLKNLRVPLVEGYATQHPRLLFFEKDKPELQKRAIERPDLWNNVLANAELLKPIESIPAPDVIRTGAKYWRIERVQSAALAWYITGDDSYRDGAMRWMLAHCKVGLWGDSYRPNVDLVASWYLYHISAAYDILRDEMKEEDRKAIRESLAEHARHIYLEYDPYPPGRKFNYDQNHSYIPAVALVATALALIDDVPEAKHWLTRGFAVLGRSRYVQPEDGYYYEGYGYWTYALNWHARGAELLARATGEKLFDIPVLRDTWLFGLQLSLPGTPGAYGIGDSTSWANGKLQNQPVNNYSMLWEIAAQTGSRESQAVGDLYAARQPERDYPATAFLWFNPEVKPASLASIPPYHYFSDHDVVAWRSGWDADATSYLFRCGPPLGHKAAEKLIELKDFSQNCGHVHPDIGGFWMFAKGTYLAIDTGYTTDKWTRDHNTLLVDDKGQGSDGLYWNDKGFPYQELDKARITSQYLSPGYGFASGEFGAAYSRSAPGVNLSRTVLMSKDWLLIVDDMAADKPRSLTWLCHSMTEFQKDGASYISRQPTASLAVVPLAPAKLEAKPEPTMIMAGITPGKGTPEQRGFKLGLRSAEPSVKTRFVNVLFPLGTEEKVPQVELIKNEENSIGLVIKWPNGQVETVDLDIAWKPGQKPEPATIKKS